MNEGLRTIDGAEATPVPDGEDVLGEIASCLARVRDALYDRNVGGLIVRASTDLFDLHGPAEVAGPLPKPPPSGGPESIVGRLARSRSVSRPPQGVAGAADGARHGPTRLSVLPRPGETE